MIDRRKVLLADPLMFGHSLLYYRAALASAGYQNTEFTLVTQAHDESDRERLLAFAKGEPRLKVHLLGVLNRQCEKRLESWQAFGRAMRSIEKILQSEAFDLAAYLYLDLALVFFALPVFRFRLRSHYQAGIAGLIFRDNGLRAPLANKTSARLKSQLDRWLLARALKSGAFRRVAFLDHWCADQAAACFNTTICGYGVDPIFHRPYDSKLARAELGLKPEDFVILFFGTMSDRKSAVESLALLRKAPLPKERTAIIVAGPSAPAYRETLNCELAATRQKYRVIHHDRFIGDAELPRYFAAASCVVCVYKEFTGSSSVLLHAAIFGKPALVSPGGAMEDAVRRHNFGGVVSLGDPVGFTAAATRLANLEESTRISMAKGAEAYGKSMDARRFMSQFE